MHWGRVGMEDLTGRFHWTPTDGGWRRAVTSDSGWSLADSLVTHRVVHSLMVGDRRDL